MTAKAYTASFWDDKNVLKLTGGVANVCKYPSNYWIVYIFTLISSMTDYI